MNRTQRNMELIKQLRVVTSEQRCILKQTNTYHMNMNGFSLPSKIGKTVFCKIDNFWCPPKKKKVEFAIYFGIDKSSVNVKLVKKIKLDYCSMEDLCMQINGTVWHEFLSEKKTTEVNKPEPSDESGSSVEKPLSDEVLLEIRKKLFKIEECSNDILFHLKYEHGRFSLKMKRGYAIVLTGSIINKLGFDVEVKDEDIIKMNHTFLVGKPCKFLEDNEKICHLSVKDMVEQVCFRNGSNFGIVCSYNFETGIMTSPLCRLSCNHVRELQFCLLDDSMNYYYNGNELENNDIRFTVNFYIFV